MRQLTVRRRKVFAGCLAKMAVYIEDPASGTLSVGGVPCRKLGELKNGTEQTFTVDDGAATLFVVPAGTTKERYLERIVLPEGQDDLVLEGQCYVNILGGNAFCFDANNNEAAKKTRKRNTVLGVLLLCAVAVISGVISYTVTSAVFSSPTSPKEFSSEGLTITLTEEFRETTAESYTAAFESRRMAVIALREPFYLAAGFSDYTLEDYAQLVIDANALTGEIQSRDGRLFFEYDATVNEDSYHYVAYVYKCKDAFWTINFATHAEDAAEYAEQIHRFAASVGFY